MRVWVLFCLLEAHVEHLGHVYPNNLHVNFSDGLAKADAPAAQEWAESVIDSFFAIRSQRQLTAAVKALGQKLFWLLPVVTVPVHPSEVDLHYVATLD